MLQARHLPAGSPKQYDAYLTNTSCRGENVQQWTDFYNT